MTLLRFADPAYLLLLLGVPLLAWWYVVRGRSRTGSLRYSSLASIARADRRRTGRYHHALFVLRSLGLAALIVAFARPQTGVTAENVTTEGIDIVLALDLSTSMLAEDLEPNRIEAAKAVAADFVNGRQNDRIGLVVFAGDAFTQVPLTLDYGIVTTVLGELETGILEDGTAIGMGLATAVKRLQRLGSRVEGDRAADRRPQQPRRDRPGHGSSDGTRRWACGSTRSAPAPRAPRGYRWTTRSSADGTRRCGSTSTNRRCRRPRN